MVMRPVEASTGGTSRHGKVDLPNPVGLGPSHKREEHRALSNHDPTERD